MLVGIFFYVPNLIAEEVRTIKYKNLTASTKLPQYVPVPITLFQNDISSTALLIYGLLLGRALLSAKNGWIDEFDNVFIRYTNANLAKDICKSISTIKNCMKELEAEGLIKTKRVGFSTKNIYVCVPVDEQETFINRAENEPVNSQKTVSKGVQKLATNKYKNINNLSNNKYVRKDGESF